MRLHQTAMAIVGAFLSASLMAQTGQAPQGGNPPPSGPGGLPGGFVYKPPTGKPDSSQAIDEFNQIYGYLQTDGYSARNSAEATRRVLEFGKKYPDTAAAYALLGELKYTLFQVAGGCGMTDEVVMLAEKAVSMNPNSAEGYTLGAKASLCNRDAAYYWYADNAIALAPNKPEALFVKARVLSQEGKFRESEEFFRKAIDASPEPRRKANLSRWLVRMLTSDERPREDILADLSKSEETYRKIIQLDPNSTSAKCEFKDFIVQFKSDISGAAQLVQQVEQAGVGCWTGMLAYADWANKYLAGKESPKALLNLAERTRLVPDDAFIQAARYPARGDVVRALLKAKAVSAIDTLGRGDDRGVAGCCPAIVNAAYQGDLELTGLLLKNGANVNAEGDSKRTPLAYAVISGDVKLADYLLSNGARPNATFDNGYVALYRAIFSRRNSKALAEVLLKHRANPNATTQGRSMLEWAVFKDEIEIAKLLISFSANPNPPIASSPLSRSPLQIAASKANVEMVTVLLAAGAKDDIGRITVQQFFNKFSVDPASRYSKMANYQAIFALLEAARGIGEKSAPK